MDPNPEYQSTYGKRYLHGEPGELETNITLETLRSFKKEHPDFIGHRRIYQVHRKLKEKKIRDHLKHAKALHRYRLHLFSGMYFFPDVLIML